ncbi:hypothetical protein ACQKIE_12260 [Luteibacter sp. NPDC031894]|uniref:hypothetical protein n=1 Tax=Luteibacter sp. NPDC031894 TaxID=3390572 RepID=UPI003CFCB295
MPYRRSSLARITTLAFALPIALFASVTQADDRAVSQTFHPQGAALEHRQPVEWNRTMPHRARPGDLDPTFGESGRVTVPSRGFALPTGDGKYWVVAKRENTPGRVEVRRLLDNGAPDPTFPLDGAVVDLYPGAQDFELFAMRRQSNGKVILGGRLFLADGTTVPLFARLRTDGQLDTAFGRNGIALVDFDDEAPIRYLYGIDIQRDDKIVASTLSDIGGKIFPRLVRLGADGTQDPGFGRNGVVYDMPEGVIFLSTAALDDGNLLFGGMSEPNENAVVTRLRSDGTVDNAFGEAGFVHLDHRDHPGMRVGGAVQAHRDGSVVVGGTSLTPTLSGWAARLLPNGTLDRRFNNGSPLFAEYLSVYAMAKQDDGKIVLSGASRMPDQRYMAVGRLNQDGSFDTSFGQEGIALTPAPAQNAYSNAYSYVETQGSKLFVSDVVMTNDIYEVQLLRYDLTH